MKKNSDIPIGGIGIISGYRVMAKEYLLENTCDDCCFSKTSGYHWPCPFDKCFARTRQDKTHVYFVIAEKGDEK